MVHQNFLSLQVNSVIHVINYYYRIKYNVFIVEVVYCVPNMANSKRIVNRKILKNKIALIDRGLVRKTYIHIYDINMKKSHKLMYIFT
jgi:hypothetical protein